MIAMIRGSVYAAGETTLVLDTGNLGYEVHVTARLLCSVEQGEELELHTYQQYREDGVSLFGFSAQEELEMFRWLINVNGVGPKMALALLSAKSRNEVILAIVNERADVLSEVSGIGPKTARRIILELKDRMTSLVEAMDSPRDLLPDPAVDLPVPGGRGPGEAVEALMGLGYTRREVEPVVRRIHGELDESDAGMLVRMTLKELGQKRSNG
jgi:Holliday junction DNA helicase RuvA